MGCWYGSSRWQRRRQWAAWRAEPFPEAWRDILLRQVPVYERLPDHLRQELEDDIQVFVQAKRFVGCQGLEITDEIRVTIAAQACLLIVNQPKRYFPKLSSIYVYPSAYIVDRTDPATGIVSEGGQVNLGESWRDGRLVLAWDASRQGAMNLHDGRNVVYHEFAHQLDQADGQGDGVPDLRDGCYASWVDVLGKEYRVLKRPRARSVVDRYGATNGAEFFASATEAFFEKAKLLRMRHPDLYQQLSDYYQLDPANW